MIKSKYKVDIGLVISLVLMAIISIVSIYFSTSILPNYMSNLALKQIMWYGVGFLLILLIMYLGNDFIIKNIWYIYGFGIISLILLLLFAEPINNAKCWFSLPGIGTIQPSEFMKIILIIALACMIDKFRVDFPKPTVKDEFIFLIKVMIIIFIPSILTFLQPDTGVVLIYLLITLIMLFIGGIRYRWFIILISILLLLVGSVVLIYFINTDLFVNIFGTDFFLRIDRLLDWSSSTGFQLENGKSAIGSGGMFGNLKVPVYFPEAQTDFIFAVYSSTFGFIGSFLLLFLITYFDLKLITTALKSKKRINKYIISGTIGMLMYQQLQNIGMTFGLMPITGITLPFISYGGSSLLSYIIMMGIVFNISDSNLKTKIYFMYSTANP